MHKSTTNNRLSQDNLFIITINLIVFLLLIISLLMLKNYNIQYGTEYGSQLFQYNYNYSSWNLIFAIVIYIAFNSVLVFTVRNKTLVPKYERKTQIISYILLNSFIFLQLLTVFILLMISPAESFSNIDYKNDPFYNFIQFSTLIAICALIVVGILSISDIYTNINTKKHIFHASINAKTSNFDTNQISQQTDTLQNSSNAIRTLIINKKNELRLLFISIFFLSLSSILAYLVIYYNNKFINEVLSSSNVYNSTYPTYYTLYNQAESTVLFSQLSVLCFIIFIIMLFLLFRKLLSNSSNKVNLGSLLLYEGILFIFLILFSYFSNIYRNKVYLTEYPDTYFKLNSFFENKWYLFSSLEIITISAMIFVGVFIFIYLFIFNKKFLEYDNNIAIDYSPSIYRRIITGSLSSKDSQNLNPIDRQPTNFINQHGTNVTSLNCPTCGAQISLHDKFCPKCGLNLENSNSIL